MSSRRGSPGTACEGNMSCPKCKSELPEGSAFCNKCGASLVPGAAAPPLTAAQIQQEPEQELWKGRFSGKSQGHWWVLWFLELPVLAFLWLRFVPPHIQSGPRSEERR